MVEHVGDVIRSAREGAGVSQSALAHTVHISKSFLCNIEAGRRRLTPELAVACDRALGTTPLLVMLWQLDDGTGDNVRRRALFNAVGMVAGTIGLNGAGALAEVVRSGILDSAGQHEDWDAVVRDYDRRLVVAPTREFGSSLLSQMLVAKQQMIDNGKSPERLRALAHLGQLYGLWMGNLGDVPAARGWYRTARSMAAQSGDTKTEAFVHGRALSRGVYEGDTARQTLAGVHQVLSLRSGPCAGFLESYSALVHVHALTGNLAGGRAAIVGMRNVAEALPDDGEAIGPQARTEQFNSYLECRLGSLPDAERAYHTARPMLRAAPVWDADARIYYGRAHVRAGAIDDGVRLALDAVTSLDGVEVKVLRVGVQDLLSVVPAQHRSDEVEELRTYAATGPAPWETV